MEPTDLKPTPPDDAALDAWLRTNASLPALADNGFSRNVLCALPRPAQPRISRRWFVLGGMASGIAVAVIGTLTSGLLGELPSIDTALTQMVNQMFTLPALTALGLAVLSLWYAFRDRLRLLPRL